MINIYVGSIHVRILLIPVIHACVQTETEEFMHDDAMNFTDFLQIFLVEEAMN